MATKNKLLPPDNLGSRHQALNKNVRDAVAENVDFNTLKDNYELSAVDRFFKIELAAKYKNVDYIMETLKSGDTLYVARALKRSQWLYDDEFTHIINPEFMEANIFPETSERVKRLILKTVATRVRNEKRAIEFFNYFVEKNLPEIAFKCLRFTSEAFKLDILQNCNKPPYDKIIRRNVICLQLLIGKSLKLFEKFLEITDRIGEYLKKFRHLYYVNGVKYLELCEKYSVSYIFNKQMSNDIMKKNKDRVLANPFYYTEQVNEEVLLKNSTSEDVKVYLSADLPSDIKQFWDYWGIDLKSIAYMDKIPTEERYAFLKKIFCEKYPGEDFEMTKGFYVKHYYKYLTVEEREEWAWNQIKSEKQVLGVGKDYIWYKFINFKDAFEAIKKYIIITKDAERRKGIINVLIHSAKNNRELETLFKHYHRRHNNELRSHKEYFLAKVIDIHNVFDFDEPCFNAFYTLLLNVELYDISEYNNAGYNENIWIKVKYTVFKNVVLFYHVLHHKSMDEKLLNYLKDEFYPEYGVPELGSRDTASILYILVKIDDEKRSFLYDFLLKFYMDSITQYKYEHFSNDVRKKVERWARTVKQLMYIFNPFEKEWKWDSFKSSETKKPKEETSCTKLLRELKKDKTHVTETFLDIHKRFENKPTNIDGFLKKVKLYFANDLAKDIVKPFEELLTNITIDQNTVNACVKAIFVLSEISQIVEFMKRYAPENTKIDHNYIDPHQLRIQKAICRFACIPRPPVPLSTVLLYMKGDYVQYCLHMFSTYPAILSPAQCIEFVKTLVDAPVSIQKHALRLACKYFDDQKLKEVSLNLWNNTKNVSVRCAIYKGLFKRQVERNGEELFDTLKVLTLDLNEDDDRSVFRLTESNVLSDEYIGVYKEAAWTALSQFKDKQPNVQRKCNLLHSLLEIIHLMREEFVTQIVEDHITLMLSEKMLYLCLKEEPITDLYKEKWNLTYTYLLHFASTSYTNTKHIGIVNTLVKICLANWEERYEGMKIYQDRIWDIYRKCNDLSLTKPQYFEKAVVFFENIFKSVKSDLLAFEGNKLRCELELGILNRNVLLKVKNSIDSDEGIQLVNETLTRFGEGVGKLVSRMVNDKIYFSFHIEYLRNAMCEKVKELVRITLAGAEEDEVNTNKALVEFSLGLVKVEIVETYMLAVQILPTDCEVCSKYDTYHVVIERVQKYDDPDVQYALYHKLRNECKE